MEVNERVNYSLHSMRKNVSEVSVMRKTHPTHYVSVQTYTEHAIIHTIIYTIIHIQILMESTLYETTERAFIDSLGLFSIKKIPFGIKESFP